MTEFYRNIQFTRPKTVTDIQ